MKMDDKISILMCVFNTKREYLQDAVYSVLNQDYTNIEFIIVDDCSTSQETIEVLNGIENVRVQVIHNENNLGLTRSLNIGLKYCTGKYLARMDSDDISDCHRISEQLRYLKENNFKVIGSAYNTTIEKQGLKQRKIHYAEDITKQKIRMLFGNMGIIHSSAFIDLDFMKSESIYYNESYRYAQDYALWCDFISKGIAIGCCNRQLITLRINEEQISKKYRKEQKQCAKKIRKEYLKNIFKISKEDADRFVDLVTDDMYKKGNILAAERLLKRFINNNKKYYPRLRLEVYRFWLIQLYKGFCNRNYKMLFCKMGLCSISPISLIYCLVCRRNERI